MPFGLYQTAPTSAPQTLSSLPIQVAAVQRGSAFDVDQTAPTLAPQTSSTIQVAAVQRGLELDVYQTAPTSAPQTLSSSPVQLAAVHRSSAFDVYQRAPTSSPQTLSSSPVQLAAVQSSSAFDVYQRAPTSSPQTSASLQTQPSTLVYQVTPTTTLPPVSTASQLDQSTALSMTQPIQQDSTAEVEKCWMDLRKSQDEVKQLTFSIQSCENETQIINSDMETCVSKRQEQDNSIVLITKEKDAEAAKFRGCAEALNDRRGMLNLAQANTAAEKRLRVACTQAHGLTVIELGFANSNLSYVNNQLEISNGEVQRLNKNLDDCHNKETQERTRRNAKEGELGICKAEITKIQGSLRDALFNYKTLNTTAGYCCSVKSELNFTLKETRTDLETCQDNLENARMDSRELVVTQKNLKAAEHLAASYKEASRDCDSSRLSCTRELFGNTTVLRTCEQDLSNLGRGHSILTQNLTIALDDLSIAATSLNESSRLLRVCEDQRDTTKIKKDEYYHLLEQCKQDILCECSQMSSLQEQFNTIKLAKEEVEVRVLTLKDRLLSCQGTKDKINLEKQTLTFSLADLVKNDNSSILTEEDRTKQIWMAMTFVFAFLFWVVSIMSCFLAYDKRRLHRCNAELVEKLRHTSHQSRELSLALNSPSVAAATFSGILPAIPVSSNRGSEDSLL